MSTIVFKILYGKETAFTKWVAPMTAFIISYPCKHWQPTVKVLSHFVFLSQ